MGRTNIVLDDRLVADCLKATRIKSRRGLVDYALRELLRRERRKKILGLKGAVHWEGNLAAWRSRRFPP